MSVPVLLLGKPLFFYWLYRGGKGLRRHRVSLCCVHPLISYLLNPRVNTDDMAPPPLPSQGYERGRRASEEDGAQTPQYDEDEEEGIEELTSREATAPKQVSTCRLLPATWQHDSKS